VVLNPRKKVNNFMPNIEKEAQSSEKPEIILVSPGSVAGVKQNCPPMPCAPVQNCPPMPCAPDCLPYCRIKICTPRGAPPLPWPPRPQ